MYVFTNSRHFYLPVVWLEHFTDADLWMGGQMVCDCERFSFKLGYFCSRQNTFFLQQSIQIFMDELFNHETGFHLPPIDLSVDDMFFFFLYFVILCWVILSILVFYLCDLLCVLQAPEVFLELSGSSAKDLHGTLGAASNGSQLLLVR